MQEKRWNDKCIANDDLRAFALTLMHYFWHILSLLGTCNTIMNFFTFFDLVHVTAQVIAYSQGPNQEPVEGMHTYHVLSNVYGHTSIDIPQLPLFDADSRNLWTYSWT